MPAPTLDQRLALRERPAGFAVMRQRWSKLLFLHWKFDPSILAEKLPPGLHVDLHDGEAWLGIVPFAMERIRPVGLPPVPGLSWFLELNVRTYVHDDHGVPGVWFFSLDCNQPLAVEFARRRFHLPYKHAEMRAKPDSGDRIHYECRRKSENGIAAYRYQAAESGEPAPPGSLEFFLAERYLLYSSTPNGELRHGRVHHQPYRLAPGRCEEWSPLPAAWDGIPLPDRVPDSVISAKSVDVSVFPLRR